MGSQVLVGVSPGRKYEQKPDDKSAVPLVLALEPQVGLQIIIRDELSIQGFRVVTVHSGAEGVRLAERQRPHLVLIESLLPDMGGLEAMRILRRRSNVPVIFLGSCTKLEDKVRALELGADDYIEEPFDPGELCSRIRAVLRRTMNSGKLERILISGGIQIDLNRRVVRRDGEIVYLTRSEWLLLEHLAANPGRVMLNEEILTKVWGPEYSADIEYLRVWISRLRRKLEERSGRTIIRTAKGIGYMLDTQRADSAAAA
jgi:two-component system KDP operon response regulator KdpE